MLIFFVFFVSFNIFMIRSEDNNIINIEISHIKDEQRRCDILNEITLFKHRNVTLQIKSEYFIRESTWIRYTDPYEKKAPKQLEHLPHSNISINYMRTIGSHWNNDTQNTIIYTFTHNQIAPLHQAEWTFSFEVIKDYNPWNEESNYNIQEWTCTTLIKIGGNDLKNHGPGNRMDRSYHQDLPNKFDGQLWLIIVLSVIATLLVAQSTYIIWGKIRDRKSFKNSDKEAGRNIADRPPLPLPPDEVIRGDPVPPLPLSPGPIRHHHYPTTPMLIKAENSYLSQPGPIPLNSYRNEGLDTSEEEIPGPGSATRLMEAKKTYEVARSPDFSRRPIGGNTQNIELEEALRRRNNGPSVQKQLYLNKVIDNSDEELRSTNFGRRHEGPLVPKASYKNNALESSVEELRSPDFARRQPGPLLPKSSYKNKVINNSAEELKSPEFHRRHEGPLVPKQSYKNKPSDDSDEEIKSPGMARRHIEATLAQLPPKGLKPSKSFKVPRPLPRRTSSPPLPPEKPAFHPAHRLGDAQCTELEEALRRRNNGNTQNIELEEALRRRNNDPGPPLFPKKPVFFATPDACRAQDSRKFSEDEWQYERLEPDSKYLNNLPNNTPFV